MVDIELSSPRGLAEETPVCGTVAGSTEAGSLDEGLQQDGAVAVLLLPVLGDPTHDHSQDAGREVVAADPWRDEEASVVYDQVKSGLPLLGGPAYEAVTGPCLPSCGTEAEQGDDATLGSDEVPHLGTGQRLVAQVPVLPLMA